jgi:hypothetical protein
VKAAVCPGEWAVGEGGGNHSHEAVGVEGQDVGPVGGGADETFEGLPTSDVGPLL